MAYEGMTLRFEPSSPEGVDLAKHEEQLGGQLKVRIHLQRSASQN
jgi:hypothetical protein